MGPSRTLVTRTVSQSDDTRKRGRSVTLRAPFCRHVQSGTVVGKASMGSDSSSPSGNPPGQGMAAGSQARAPDRPPRSATDVARGQEVSARVVRALAGRLGARGVDVSRLCEGLSFSLGDLEHKGRRAAWDEFAVLVERAEKAVGGPVEFQDLCAAMI